MTARAKSAAAVAVWLAVSVGLVWWMGWLGAAAPVFLLGAALVIVLREIESDSVTRGRP